MEFIILNIKLIAAYFVTFILFCIFFQILNRSRLHTFVIMQKLIRNSGKRKLIKFFLTISFMMLNLLLIGRVDITIYQMGTVLGAGFALIHILTKPLKKVNSKRRVEHTQYHSFIFVIARDLSKVYATIFLQGNILFQSNMEN